MTIEEDVQSATPGKLVELYELDLTALGGGIQRWTPSVSEGGSVSFDGNVYTPAPITADGFETTAEGEQPRPTLRIGNVQAAAVSLIRTYDDLVGALVRRTRTFAHHLDGAPDEDPDAILDLQVYRILQKSQQNRVFAEWVLGSPLDHDAAQIPRRQALPNYCTARYRRWDPDSAAFVYDTTTLACPYVGSSYFDIQDQPVASAAQDRASKTLGCCRARFGANAALPFMNEPAIGRVR